METSKKDVIPTLFWCAACALIIASIIGGLLISGGPSRQKLIRFDQTRSDHLNRLENKIDQYFREKKSLPAKLDDLKALDDSDLTENTVPVDPLTQQSYSYFKLSDSSFKVCATFQIELLPNSKNNLNGEYFFRSLRYHKKGLQCLSKTLKAPTLNHD